MVPHGHLQHGAGVGEERLTSPPAIKHSRHVEHRRSSSKGHCRARPRGTAQAVSARRTCTTTRAWRAVCATAFYIAPPTHAGRVVAARAAANGQVDPAASTATAVPPVSATAAEPGLQAGAATGWRADHAQSGTQARSGSEQHTLIGPVRFARVPSTCSVLRRNARAGVES